jgi:drug/metabolite transporter (DMT)-like permease
MIQPSNATPQPWLLLFLSVAAIWGGSFMFMQTAALEFGALATACLRMAIGALVMLPLLWWRGLLPQLVQHWRIIFGISLVNAAIPFACYAFAVMHISTGLSAILNATTPMFTALVAWLWLGQSLSRLRIAGVAIGFLGVALLASEQASLKGPSMWLSIAAIAACLVATLCYAVSGNAIKNQLSQLHPWVIAGGTMLGAAVWLLIPAALTWPTAAPSVHAWMSLGLVGTVCSAVAFMLYFELMQRVDIARTASVTYLIPVFALGYAALFLQEHITLWMLGCGLIVVLGTALSTGFIQTKGQRGLTAKE